MYTHASRFLLLILSSSPTYSFSTLSACVIRIAHFDHLGSFSCSFNTTSKKLLYSPLREYHAFHISARRLVTGLFTCETFSHLSYNCNLLHETLSLMRTSSPAYHIKTADDSLVPGEIRYDRNAMKAEHLRDIHSSLGASAQSTVTATSPAH